MTADTAAKALGIKQNYGDAARAKPSEPAVGDSSARAGVVAGSNEPAIPAIEAAAKAYDDVQQKIFGLDKHEEALTAAIFAYLAALPSDREAAQAIAAEILANRTVMAASIGAARISATLAAARAAGAREERKACINEFLIRHAATQEQADFGNAILAAIRARGEP